jgi:hypothetical protein
MIDVIADAFYSELEKIAADVSTGSKGLTISGRKASFTVGGNPWGMTASATVKRKLTPKLSLVGEGSVSPERRYGGVKLRGSFGGTKK